MHSGPNAVNRDVNRDGLLGTAIALPKCCWGRIGVAPTACSRGLAESGMRVLVPPLSTPDRGHEEKPLFNESKRWLCHRSPSPSRVGALGSAIARKALTRPAPARVALFAFATTGWHASLVPIRRGAAGPGLAPGQGRPGKRWSDVLARHRSTTRSRSSGMPGRTREGGSTGSRAWAISRAVLPLA